MTPGERDLWRTIYASAVARMMLQSKTPTPDADRKISIAAAELATAAIHAGRAALRDLPISPRADDVAVAEAMKLAFA